MKISLIVCNQMFAQNLYLIMVIFRAYYATPEEFHPGSEVRLPFFFGLSFKIVTILSRLGDLELARIRLHKNDAARTRAARLRKRLESLRGSFVGSSLVDYYLARGADLSVVSVVPAVRLNEFFESLPGMTWQTFLESLRIPYVRYSKRLNTIRVVTSA